MSAGPGLKRVRRPRKLTEERAAAINRRRDLIEGQGRSFDYWTTRVLPGRGQTVKR